MDSFSATPKASKDAQEIHDTKLWSSIWGSIPYIGLFAFTGNLFTSPEKKATERADVKMNNRNMYSAVEQEKELKNAKLKSQLAAVIIPILLPIAFSKYSLTREALQFTIITFIIGFCVPLGYLFGENPADPNFNKKL